MKIVAESFQPNQIKAYLDAHPYKSPFSRDLVVIHHTASPSLDGEEDGRPNGLTAQHIQNLKSYYESLGWSSGPHFFVDDHQIWAFTPVNERGTHAKAFNKNGIGIEMLGDYDSEDPWSGRGLKVLENTRALVKQLVSQYDLTANDIRFHRDDPQTSKTCPGTKINKQQFLDFLAQ
jgi:N-acetylmuramoyl-L-alanine amidase CwlA